MPNWHVTGDSCVTSCHIPQVGDIVLGHFIHPRHFSSILLSKPENLKYKNIERGAYLLTPTLQQPCFLQCFAILGQSWGCLLKPGYCLAVRLLFFIHGRHHSKQFHQMLCSFVLFAFMSLQVKWKAKHRCKHAVCIYLNRCQNFEMLSYQNASIKSLIHWKGKEA